MSTVNWNPKHKFLQSLQFLLTCNSFAFAVDVFSFAHSRPLVRLVHQNMQAVAVSIGTGFLNSAIDYLVQNLGSSEVLGFFSDLELVEELLKKLAEPSTGYVETINIDAPRRQSFNYNFTNFPSSFSFNKTSLQEVALELDFGAAIINTVVSLNI